MKRKIFASSLGVTLLGLGFVASAVGSANAADNVPIIITDDAINTVLAGKTIACDSKDIPSLPGEGFNLYVFDVVDGQALLALNVLDGYEYQGEGTEWPLPCAAVVVVPPVDPPTDPPVVTPPPAAPPVTSKAAKTNG